MGLTAEQHAVRATGIGASEIPTVAGLSPSGQGPLDVWLRKPTAQRAALAVEEDDTVGPAEIGDELQSAVLSLYRRRTGLDVQEQHDTVRHPEHAWALASPDGRVTNAHYVEAKVVGFRMARDWEDGPPDYVVCQALWQLFVLRAELIDTVALIGTELRVHPVLRDDGLIADLFEIGRAFWFDHVLTDVPPGPSPNESRTAYLRKRFRGSTGEILTVPAEHAEYVAALARKRIAASVQLGRAEAALESIDAEFMELIGEAGGLQGAWGKATWLKQQGQVSYKSVATALAECGRVPAALMEAHRGPPFRKFDFRAAKEK
jgi:putative phage-type endonuclease